MFGGNRLGSTLEDAISAIHIEYEKIENTNTNENLFLHSFLPAFVEENGDLKDFSVDELDEYSKGVRDRIFDIGSTLKDNNFEDGDDRIESVDKAMILLSIILNRFKDSVTLVMLRKRFRRNMQSFYDTPIDEVENSSLLEQYSLDDMNPHQRLLLRMLAYFKLKGYRRDGDRVCREVEGTRYWEHKDDIINIIYEVNSRQEVSQTEWSDAFKSASAIANVTESLKNILDRDFRPINRCRKSWSFKNGVFSDGVFYKYGSIEFLNLPDDLVTSRYYPDVDFDPDGSTPCFDKLTSYQKWDPETTKFFKALIGRMCYDLGERDNWQIVPFCLGVAQSGKSTIVTHVVSKLYDPGDVGTLSNNIERGFGIGALLTKKIVIGPEIKRDLNLEQAEFQSMVSGEEVQVATKHLTARSVKWKIPMFLAGNEPCYQNSDNSGSIARRIVPFAHNERVYNADPTLPDKLQLEMGSLIPQFVSAYLEYAERFHDVTVIDHLPSQIVEWKREIAGTLNSLVGFLNSTYVVYDKDFIVPESEFVNHYKQYCQSVSATHRKWEKSLWASAFGEKNLKSGFGLEHEIWVNPNTNVPQDVLNRIVIRGCNINPN
jgi:hypothetical protein